MEVSLLILSCDNYSDLWEPFFKLKSKYWKDCNYKTYITTETKDCKYAKALKHNYPIEQWTTRLKKSLEEIDTKYVLIMDGDFFIRDYVDQARIDYALSHFNDNTAFFNFEQEYDNYNVECGLEGFKKRVKGICKTSCQAGLWNREKLIKLLNVSCSPWEWERLNIARDYDYYINSGSLIINYGYKVGDFSIVHGKWSKEIVPFFEKENIKIDYSKRGFFLDDKKFSVVIPNYNNESWINKSVGSVLEQTYKNYDLYVIDDMSTDKSVDITKSLFKSKSNLKLIENEIKLYNGGSRNVGILKARKENPDGYLVFIDSDDWLADNKVLEDLNKFIIENNNPDIITLGFQTSKSGALSQKYFSRYIDKFNLFKADTTCCAVWLKCIKVSKCPLFEYQTLMEDRNFHYRLIYRCEENKICNYERVTHIWNKDNVRSVTSDKDQLYVNDLQTTINWDNCAYRHVAGMLDILNELHDEKYKQFINSKIEECKRRISKGIYHQY